MSVLASDLNQQHKHFFKSHHSTLLKRGKRFEAINGSQTEMGIPSDVYEENEENSRVKINIPFIGTIVTKIFQLFHSAVNVIRATASPIIHTSSPPYLTLQVIRI